MEQYQATGGVKADGYSRDVFEGLNADEKAAVFNLLATELPFSAEWLFFLDAEKALIAAKDEEQKLRGNGYESVYMLQEQMVKYSGDLLYQRHMIEDYPGYISNLKPLVVDSIGRTPVNTAMVDFLRQVILREVNPGAVARAERRLSAALNIPVERMPGKFVAVSQFDATVNLLKMDLVSGTGEIIPADAVAEGDVSFGLFEVEKSASGLDYLALLATPDGPLLVFKDGRYRPNLERTRIEITGDGKCSAIRIFDGGDVVFGLSYEDKFGIGLHPYNRTREDIDFYYWLSKKINDAKFHATYTRDIAYID
ncbi:hypothetical protein GTP81_22385 [Rugamonas sp. FT107W]|uniref:Uncharacterized protein n=1 Tax=Duganella vulcania TaxID=2692166 RepID=A0A845HPS4_9BURK|nr:hypothetical protein [Duganella vulcania]MYN19495.1 hypothetical protein [Duganella vulcania]